MILIENIIFISVRLDDNIQNILEIHDAVTTVMIVLQKDQAYRTPFASHWRPHLILSATNNTLALPRVPPLPMTLITSSPVPRHRCHVST